MSVMKLNCVVWAAYFLLSFGSISYQMMMEYWYTYSLENQPNYFRPINILLIYNLIICLAAIVYKLTVFLFYSQIKQMETMNMLQKIGYKLFEFFFFIYVMESQFNIEVFLSIVIIFQLFVFHNLAHFRAQYLVHSHTPDLFGLNYRLLAQIIILIFVDFELIINTFYWLLSGTGHGDEPYILFAYYSITIALTLVQPALCFFIHFYQIYTDIILNDLDLIQAKLTYIINTIRLVIQIILSLFIAVKFAMSFLFIITILESIYQLSKNYKYAQYSICRDYKEINKFTEELKKLPTLNSEEIALKEDKTCAICYQDLTDEAVVLKKCQHLFHRQCLRQWIIKNSNKFCPKCKTPFESSQSSINQLRDDLGRFRDRLRDQLAEQKNNLEKMNQQDPLGFQRDTIKKKRQQKSSETIEEREPLKTQYENLRNKKIKSKYRGIKNHEIGSVPFGLPTEALYKRKSQNVGKRQYVIQMNQKMIRLMKMQPAKQLLFVPEI